MFIELKIMFSRLTLLLSSGGRVDGVPDGPREAADARTHTRPQLPGWNLSFSKQNQEKVARKWPDIISPSCRSAPLATLTTTPPRSPHPPLPLLPHLPPLPPPPPRHLLRPLALPQPQTETGAQQVQHQANPPVGVPPAQVRARQELGAGKVRAAAVNTARCRRARPAPPPSPPSRLSPSSSKTTKCRRPRSSPTSSASLPPATRHLPQPTRHPRPTRLLLQVTRYDFKQVS